MRNPAVSEGKKRVKNHPINHNKASQLCKWPKTLPDPDDWGIVFAGPDMQFRFPMTDETCTAMVATRAWADYCQSKTLREMLEVPE